MGRHTKHCFLEREWMSTSWSATIPSMFVRYSLLKPWVHKEIGRKAEMSIRASVTSLLMQAYFHFHAVFCLISKIKDNPSLSGFHANRFQTSPIQSGSFQTNVQTNKVGFEIIFITILIFIKLTYNNSQLLNTFKSLGVLILW